MMYGRMNGQMQVEKALRKKTTAVEVNENLPHVGSLTLWSAGLTRLFRFLLVLVFEPVHEQAVPGRAEHSEELSHGKGVCVGADCRGQRGVGRRELFRTAFQRRPPTRPCPCLTLQPAPQAQTSLRAQSPAELSAPTTQGAKSPEAMRRGAASRRPHLPSALSLLAKLFSRELRVPMKR